MVFQRASFVFHAQGQMFEPRIRFLELGSIFWRGNLLGVNNGSRKKLFCDGIILWWKFKGIPKTQMNSIVYRTHLGRLLCPKPSLFNHFQGIYHFPGKLGNAPACSLGHCLLPLVGLSRKYMQAAWCVQPAHKPNAVLAVSA